METKSLLPLVVAALAALESFATADDKIDQQADTDSAGDKDEAATAAKPSPYLRKNNAWITLTGKVTAAEPDWFTLDYGKGAVAVEMDGWEWYQTGKAVLKGDQVTVSGRVDREAARSSIPIR